MTSKNSEVVTYADIDRRRATETQPDDSTGNPTSEPPKFGGILFFDDADALYDDPNEPEAAERSDGASSGR